MTEEERIVFIIDDEESIRSLVASIVADLGVSTQGFASAEQFLTEYRPGLRGCIVLDERLSGMTGLELQQRLAAAGTTLPVVVVTGHANVPMAVKAMQQGALSVLEKPFNNAELRRSVEQALAAESQAHTATAERQAILERLGRLTPAELSVLAQIIEGRQNKAIAASLSLGVRTVESRRASIMKKMEAVSLAELVRMAMSVDWKPSETPAPEEEHGEDEN